MSVHFSIENNIAYVEIDNPPVNAVSHAVRQGLMDALAKAESANDVEAVVLLCKGTTFVAGADVKEFGQPPLEPHLPDVVNALETATKPWVAALHGTALGGGLELALGCTYRIVQNNAKLGFPEVNLGLIPGASGTVRLPRLVGPIKALSMISSGKPVSASEAHSMGLVDEITDSDLKTEATRLASASAKQAMPVPLLQRNIPDFQHDELTQLYMATKKKARGQQSIAAVCDAIQNTLDLPGHDAMSAERKLFLKLKDGQQSKALRYIFFAERSATKIESIKDIQSNSIEHIGVVGGGTMGAGIAAACLLAGLSVTMIERDEKSAAEGRERTLAVIGGSLKRGLISETKHAEMTDQLVAYNSYSALQNADIVIEAVFEDMPVKKAAFAELDKATKADAILASNTSYLDIAQIAQGISNPSRVIGLHFFSPAHIMRLLELVIPEGTAPNAIATGVALGKRLRKITVPSGVCDGFIGNRIMSAYRRTCDYIIEDGALPHQVDEAMRDFGFPMGVFEMQDLAGLDIAWAMRKRQAATRDPSTRYVDIADKLCEQGNFGRKTGSGWYLYNDKQKPQPNPAVDKLIVDESKRKGIERRSFTDAEIMQQVLSAMYIEADNILSEGIAAKPSDIDVVMVNGYGFPRWRGGPLFMRDNPGL